MAGSVGIIIASQVLHLIIADEEQPSLFPVFYIALLASVGVAIKFSFAALGGCMTLLTIATYWKHLGQVFRAFGLSLIATGFVFIPMMARSVVMTGYPLYPQTMGAFAVDWRIPAEKAELEAETITIWARNANLPNGEALEEWCTPWINHLAKQQFAFRFPTSILLLAIIIYVFHLASPGRRRQIKPMNPLYLGFLGSAIVAIVFWFMTAPSLRFLGASYWILCVGALAFTMDHIRWRKTKILRWSIIAIAALVMVNAIPLFLEAPWQQPDPDHGLYRFEPPEVELYITNSGFEVMTPVIRDQCFDVLPCYPKPEPELNLRNSNDIADGFRLGSSE